MFCINLFFFPSERTLMSHGTFTLHRTRKQSTNGSHIMKCWNIFITDHVRSTREGYVLTRVCPSICLSTPRRRGGTPARFRQGEVPQPGGVPEPGPGGGYPTSGTPPPSDLAGGGTLTGGYLAGGYPNRGVPHLRYPPVRPGQGGVPRPGGGGGTPLSSTWYAAVGMPLVFTQEDFLVKCNLAFLPYKSLSFFHFVLCLCQIQWWPQWVREKYSRRRSNADSTIVLLPTLSHHLYAMRKNWSIF